MLREEEFFMMYKRFLLGDDKVLVILFVDFVYFLLLYCMKEYFSFRNNEEVIFNNMFRFVRNIIECVYGRLKIRWQVLNKRLDIGLKDVLNMVYVCFVLYNICEINGMIVDEEDV